METLLTVAVVVISLAVITQTGVLIAMYVMSRKVTNNVNSLVADGQKIVAPLETITTNLKSASNDLAEIGKSASEQMHRVEVMFYETREAVVDEIDDLRTRMNDTVDEAREKLLGPVRQWSALANGISAGLSTLFHGRKGATTEDSVEENFVEDLSINEERKYPAA